MPEDRDLDRLLNRLIDAALESYGDSYAQPNLAERVLLRLSNEPAPQQGFRWLPRTAIALPVAACLLLLLHYFGLRVSRPHLVPAVQSAWLGNPAGNLGSSYPRPTAGAERAGQINHAVPHPRPAPAAPQSLPNLDIFPTPTPLTPEERALETYVAHTPQAEQRALAQSEREQTPFTVASINIMQTKSIPQVESVQVESIPVMQLEAPDEGANTN